MTNQTALRIERLSKTYDTDSGQAVHALQAVDLQIQAGEFVVFLGPTGCGKTTLLNIVAGLDRPTTGQMQFADGLTQGGNIPCVFQHYTLFPWRTLAGNVAFGPAMKHLPHHERRERVHKLLTSVGLGAFSHSYPHELSGGMRQRAALAQALAADPGMLLLDEPFGALDDITRRELQQTLVDAWRHVGLTILFVTHSIDEALMLADRILVFSPRPGRIVSEHRIDLPRPRDWMSPEFTAHFLPLRKALGETIQASAPAAG